MVAPACRTLRGGLGRPGEFHPRAPVAVAPALLEACDYTEHTDVGSVGVQHPLRAIVALGVAAPTQPVACWGVAHPLAARPFSHSAPGFVNAL